MSHWGNDSEFFFKKIFVSKHFNSNIQSSTATRKITVNVSCLLEKHRIKLELQLILGGTRIKQTRMKPGGHCKVMDKIWQHVVKKQKKKPKH